MQLCKWGLSLVAAFALVVQFSMAAFAQHEGSCTITPNPAALYQSYTINATGLSTVDPVWVIATSPTGDATVSQVAVNSDGTATVITSSSTGGTWTYDFSGLQTNKKYGTLASCSVLVD